MNRRDVLSVIGGGAILGVMAGCAAEPDPLAAWRNPGVTETDPRRKALSWAVLAPNPHNMQPWLVDLRSPGEVTLHINRTRLLPATDPFDRQSVIGCGAFLELCRMAAAHDGWQVEISPFPDGEPQPTLDDRPIARLVFHRAQAISEPLFPLALKRHTNRNPFDSRPVSAEAAAAIVSAAARPGVAAAATVEPGRVALLKAIAWEGARVEAYTRAANDETADRIHFGDGDVAAHPWGISMGGPVMGALRATGLVNAEAMKQPGSFPFGQMVQSLKVGAQTARGFVWLTTRTNSRREQLDSGTAYLRAQLAATREGLAMQPWSQCLQEYAEMQPAFAAAHKALAPEGGRLQMFVRIGHGKPVPPSPRRGLDAEVLRA